MDKFPETTWILVANGERARCFERQAATRSLKELADFVHPPMSLAGKDRGGDLTGEAGKGRERTGHAGTQFEPHTEEHAKARAAFAKELAAFLNHGVQAQQSSRLGIIASSQMLGDIKPCLSAAALKALHWHVSSDLTRYTGADLEKRVNQALQFPD